MDSWQHWMKRLFPSEQAKDEAHQDPPKKRTGQFLLLAVAGVLLLLLSRLDLEQPEGQVQNAAIGLPAPVIGGEQGYESDLERRLERWLSSMRNVGNVEVMITLETTETHVYALERTVETNSRHEPGEGGDAMETAIEERTVERPIVIREDQGRSEAPLIVTTEMPTIRGVVVVADGAYDPRIRYEIFQAVQTALGVPAHRVQVFAKE